MTTDFDRAWSRLPAALQAHPGIKDLQRAHLAAISAPQGVPAGWRPTDEWLSRHAMSAAECPPSSMVVLLSSINRMLTAAPAAPKPEEAPALPERLMRFLLRDLKAERADLEGFLSLGNEVRRAAEYDEWIAAVESYCQQYAPAAPQE